MPQKQRGTIVKCCHCVKQWLIAAVTFVTRLIGHIGYLTYIRT